MVCSPLPWLGNPPQRKPAVHPTITPVMKMSAPNSAKTEHTTAESVEAHAQISLCLQQPFKIGNCSCKPSACSSPPALQGFLNSSYRSIEKKRFNSMTKIFAGSNSQRQRSFPLLRVCCPANKDKGKPMEGREGNVGCFVLF